MSNPTRTSILIGLLLVAASLAGCGRDRNPIASFQPEVVNNTDAFQFQITDASKVTTTLSYTWVNTGTRATVDHSTSTKAGGASIEIRDASGTQVYSSALIASGVQETLVGTAGNWTVRVVFANFGGTANFRAEKL
jgi:hypothetical protein